MTSAFTQIEISDLTSSASLLHYHLRLKEMFLSGKVNLSTSNHGFLDGSVRTENKAR